MKGTFLQLLVVLILASSGVQTIHSSQKPSFLGRLSIDIAGATWTPQHLRVIAILGTLTLSSCGFSFKKHRDYKKCTELHEKDVNALKKARKTLLKTKKSYEALQSGIQAAIKEKDHPDIWENLGKGISQIVPTLNELDLLPHFLTPQPTRNRGNEQKQNDGSGKPSREKKK